jgi:hydroxymethylglutaryl-CoA reductase (NADPH)
MGSNVWLGTSVLFSSAFSLLFALIVTTKMGVPLNMKMLSEGLPFFVVTIGFEKPITFTKAVLSASSALRRTPSDLSSARAGSAPRQMTIQSAVRMAVKHKGFEIVRDYLVEIAVLVAGVLSGVQGGLRQFCFLAAWILVFDCILLFTFYTAILTIKLEINRIKRQVALRKALEEEGLNQSVAEKVARNNEWPRFRDERKGRSLSPESTNPVFGEKVSDQSIPVFKVLMLSGFVLVNVINFCTMAFSREEGQTYGLYSLFTTDDFKSSEIVDPFVLASSGLSSILKSAKAAKAGVSVTVLPALTFDLVSAIPAKSTGLLVDAGSSRSFFVVHYTNQFLDVIGFKAINSMLNSFGQPTTAKWILLALVLSLALNGYLFNVARWGTSYPVSLITSEILGLPKENKEAPAKESKAHHETIRPAQNGGAVPAAPVLKKANGVSHKKATPSTGSGDDDESTRTFEECEQLVKAGLTHELKDEEVISLSLKGKIPGHALEKALKDLERAVRIRRSIVSRTPSTTGTTSLLESSLLPVRDFDYARVQGACCENVIGFLPLPLGVAGPLIIDGQSFFIPMATTEGVLVASTSRGCKAINAGGGATTVLTGDGMTRGPCVGFDSLVRAGAAKIWLDSEAGQKVMKRAFDSTSRFARLQNMKTALAGTTLFIRFKTTTGDAMGMNMISKGVEKALDVMATECGFDDMKIISVSGNYCTDKKAAAINWIDGRGKSVVAEAIIPGHLVKSILKSDVESLVELNTTKNLIGSAMAGSIGGFNAHAANIVTAIFLATGQDPAQNVESSNCITIMKK